MHGLWCQGKSKRGYPTAHTEGRAVLMQNIQYVDVDMQSSSLVGICHLPAFYDPAEVQKLRFYFSVAPVFLVNRTLMGKN
jgi:hypothetical protein